MGHSLTRINHAKRVGLSAVSSSLMKDAAAIPNVAFAGNSFTSSLRKLRSVTAALFRPRGKNLCAGATTPPFAHPLR